MSTKMPSDANGAPVTEPLMHLQQTGYDEKEPEGAVYKSTIDQVEIKQSQKFVGLSKEELEQYANDPFWRRLRYFFVALFWLAWIGLFIAAIILVITSPKCPPKPHRHWWEKKICYEIWTKSFKDSDGDGVGDLRGLTDQLPLLEASVKASAIWPTPMLRASDKDGVGVLDFKAIDPAQGDMHDLDRLVRHTHKTGMHLVMDIPLTVVSVGHEWFNKSVRREPGFENFFIWKDVDEGANNEDFSMQAGRGFYRNFNKKSDFAILNWDDAAVVNAMKDVLKFWLDKRVDGFYFGEVQYLALQENGTPLWDQVHQRLKDLNKYMREDIQERTILTFTSAGVNEPLRNIGIDEFKLQTTIQGDVDYVVSSELIFEDASKLGGVGLLRRRLTSMQQQHAASNASWPMWELGHPFTARLASRMGGRDRASLMLMLLMVMPGSINVYYGDEIGMLDTDAPGVSKGDQARGGMQWSAEKGAGATEADNLKIPAHSDYTTNNFKAQQTSDSSLKMFKRLASLRRSEDAFLYGDMMLTKEHDHVLGIVSSSNHSTTEFLTLLNFGNETQQLTLTSEQTVFFVNATTGKEGSVVTTTPNLAAKKTLKDRQPVQLDGFALGPLEGIVIKLKAKK